MLSMNNPTKGNGGANYELVSERTSEYAFLGGARRWVEFPLSGEIEMISSYLLYGAGENPTGTKNIYLNVKYYDGEGNILPDYSENMSLSYEPALYYNQPTLKFITPKGAKVIRFTCIQIDLKVYIRTRTTLEKV
ncbi:hypothetical protein BCU46_04800 [Enterovibrio norvegicus]|uniref:hypothetical protein n=1 Tax=Enterovibrio norvegicus TaxID=188144 RepID=UPI000C824EF3|nr:hypothetical protein [Enterovibrio norvegicus]PMI40722.1 hypothetical protein BCU46_04800 [Enterovibrio norvegicus]